MAGLLALLLAAPDARAGSYVGVFVDPVSQAPTPYSQGTHYTSTGTDAQGNPTFNDVKDSLYTDGSNRRGYGGGGSSTLPNGTKADCSGMIQTSWKWFPDKDKTVTTDPPPPQVIVMQTCTVSVTVERPGGAGSYQTGLGQKGTVGFNPPASLTGTATDTKYFVLAGGMSVPLPDLDAKANVTNAPSNASLSYTAAIFPVTISLGGAIQDSSGNYDILVGQGCTAKVLGLPGGTGWTITYAWNVSGITLQSWSNTTLANPKANPPVVANSQASSESDGYGTPTNPTISWYWNDNNGSGNSKPETVSCVVTLIPPAGQGAAFAVTATQKVTVYVPVWTANAVGGNMQINRAKPPSDGTDYWLHAGPTNGATETGGMDWHATVSAPAGTAFGTGSLSLVQLITNGCTYTTIDASGNISDYTWSQTAEGLDGTYPYGWVQEQPANFEYYAGDLPGIDLTALSAYSGSVDDQFEDFLLYLAPGSAQVVPVAYFKWSTNSNVAVPKTKNWKDFGSGSAGTVSPSAQVFSPSNTFPKWTLINVAEDGTWVKAK